MKRTRSSLTRTSRAAAQAARVSIKKTLSKKECKNNKAKTSSSSLNSKAAVFKTFNLVDVSDELPSMKIFDDYVEGDGIPQGFEFKLALEATMEEMKVMIEQMKADTKPIETDINDTKNNGIEDNLGTKHNKEE